MNPAFFIVGCPRSGTTLLRRMVDAHPRLAVTRETHWIPELYADVAGTTPPGFVTPELLARLFRHEKFAHLGTTWGELERLAPAGDDVTYADLVSKLFDRYGQARSKSVVGDKTPGYAQDIPMLHELWPQAKFVHLIRDGRDVCLSAVSWRKADKLAARFPTWLEHPVTTAAFWWARYVELGREGGALAGPRVYREIRYERVVSEAAKTCAELCAHLDVPYSDTMIRFHEGRTKTTPGLDAKHAWLPITAGIRDWKIGMRPDDVERFEAAAGDLLAELGYERMFPRPALDTVRETSRLRDVFIGDCQERGQPLPAAWL